MNLDGAQQEQLLEAFLSAFPTPGELEQMVALKLGANLHALAGGENLREIIFNLIQWAISKGRVDELITAAHLYNPGNPELKTFHDQFSQERAKLVGEGLSSLPKLIDKVHDTLAAFRAHFEAASIQIAIMTNYKYLHDLLHELQIHCYDRIVQEARRFPDDELAKGNLLEHADTLEYLIGRLQITATRPNFPVGEHSWIDELQQVKAILDEALLKDDPAKLNKAASDMGRLLNRHPPQISLRLNTVARALRLSQIVEALSKARDRLVELQGSQEEVAQFISGVDALSGLDHTLTIRTEEHDNWQGIDTDLRLLERFVGRYPEDFDFDWPNVKQKVDALAKGNTEDWAEKLVEYGEKVNSAIAASDPGKISANFRRFRRQALERFYVVDVNLKELCEELMKVGQPLATITRLIR